MNKLIYFGAEWCEPCAKFKPTLDQLDQSRVIKYDLETHINERNTFDIRAVPTLIIVDGDGNEIKRILGGVPLEELEQLLG